MAERPSPRTGQIWAKGKTKKAKRVRVETVKQSGRVVATNDKTGDPEELTAEGLEKDWEIIHDAGSEPEPPAPEPENEE
jgi:hypothetical protein